MIRQVTRSEDSSGESIMVMTVSRTIIPSTLSSTCPCSRPSSTTTRLSSPDCASRLVTSIDDLVVRPKRRASGTSSSGASSRIDASSTPLNSTSNVLRSGAIVPKSTPSVTKNTARKKSESEPSWPPTSPLTGNRDIPAAALPRRVRAGARSPAPTTARRPTRDRAWRSSMPRRRSSPQPSDRSAPGA